MVCRHGLEYNITIRISVYSRPISLKKTKFYNINTVNLLKSVAVNMTESNSCVERFCLFS